MATITGTVQTAYGFTKPKGPEHTHTISAVEYQTEMCFVHVIFPAGTYAQADDAEFNPIAAIQLAKKDGKTPVIISACCVGAGDENGTIVSGDIVASVTAGVIKMPLLLEDLATEHANAAMSAIWNRAITYAVWFYYTAS
jgi:hypothetical protein